MRMGELRETEAGFELNVENALVFFGKESAQFESLRASYSRYNMVRIKQNHGDQIVYLSRESDDGQFIADAQYTDQSRLALCISTADCCPLFILARRNQGLVSDGSIYIAAIHAGWRGVAQRIIPKTIEKLTGLGCDPESMKIFIGPHIQQASFEVHLDVKDQLVASVRKSLEDTEAPEDSVDWVVPSLSPGKFLVNLHLIIKQQLFESLILQENIQALYIDTKVDERFHSHRRQMEEQHSLTAIGPGHRNEKGKGLFLPGRQLSFICILNPSV